ncbi:MAG: tyrosine-type recombinase/integrase [Anaerolineales bacterium]|nr:tyrosine-type recombinase/integrase [Anaerolineales bacterium]
MTDSQQLSLFDDGSLSRYSPLHKAVFPFLGYLKGEGKTDNTLKSFRSDLNLLAEFLGEDVALGQLSTKRFQEFLQWLEYGRGIPCSRKSYARRVTTLKVFSKWLQTEKIRPDDPAAPILQRSGPAPLQHALSDEEIHQLLATADQLRFADKPDSRPYVLARLLIETGIKKSETVTLTTEDIENRYSPRPNLITRYERHNVFKERRLPISPEWIEALDEYLEQHQPKGGFIFDCTPRNLEYVLTDLAKLAGLETRASFETLRWTCAVRDYRMGMDMEDLREKMGLSQISWRETSQKIIKLASFVALSTD